MTNTINFIELANAFFKVDASLTSLGEDGAFIRQALKGADYATWEATRKATIAQLVELGRSANEAAAAKMWQRVVDDLAIAKPKADNKKAADTASKRSAKKEENAKALDFMLSKAGLSFESASPKQIMALAMDDKLTLANKAILSDAAIAKEKAENKAKETEAKKVDTAIREELRTMLNKMHGAQLAKALAALKKIK